MNFNLLFSLLCGLLLYVGGSVHANAPAANKGLQVAVQASGGKASSRLTHDLVKTENMLDAIQAGNALLVSKLLDDWSINARVGDKKRTIAHYAVIHNHPNVLDILLHKGANINMIDLDGYTPYDLWLENYAQQLEREESKTDGTTDDKVGELLLNNKALGAPQVSKGTKFYHDLFTSRLLEVSEEGNRKLVERFLALGADPMRATLMLNPKSRHDTETDTNQGIIQGKNRKLVHTLPIHVAIENGYPAIAAILLRAMNNQQEVMSRRELDYTYDAPLTWGIYYRSWSPVQWAIFAEDWAMVEDILRDGASLNHLNREHSVGLNEQSLSRYDGSMIKHGGVEYHSSRMDAYDTAEFIGATDKLLAAISSAGRDDLIAILIRKASTTGRTDVYDKLTEHGVDLRTGELAKMAMQFALAQPNYTALEYLIQLRQGGIQDNGHAVAEQDNSLNEYVGMAEDGDSRLLSLALRYGADPDGDRTALNETLLLRSYKLKHRYNRGKIAKILLEYGANPNIADADDKTILFYAVSQLQDWIEFPLMLKWIEADVRELLIHKANPNRQSLGKTPLHIAVLSAAAHDHGGLEHVLNIIKLLVAHGADTTIKDNQGRDVLDYVEQISDATKAQLILDALSSP